MKINGKITALIVVSLFINSNIIMGKTLKEQIKKSKQQAMTIERKWQCGNRPEQNNCTPQEIEAAHNFFSANSSSDIIKKLKDAKITASPDDIARIKKDLPKFLTKAHVKSAETNIKKAQKQLSMVKKSLK